MLVTLLGMVMLLSPVFAKAEAPMLVTLLGMVMLLSPVFAKAEAPMLVTLLGMLNETPVFALGYRIKVLRF